MVMMMRIVMRMKETMILIKGAVNVMKMMIRMH